MRFALLGVDDDALTLVRAIAESDKHDLSLVCQPGHRLGDVQHLVPAATVERHWESLLARGDIDAVVVAPRESQDELDDQLRKLVQAAVPLLVVHPLCEAIVALELEMIRQDTGGILVPFFPGRAHPAIARLAGLVRLGAESPLGSPEHLIFERNMAQRNRRNVLRQLARDASLIRSIAGEVSSLSAMGAAAAESPLGSLSVHLSTASTVLVHWSVQPAANESVARLKLVGDARQASLTVTADSRHWLLSIGGDPQAESFDDWNEAAAAVESFCQEVVGNRQQPSWQDACRDLDVADAAERSLQRKRTIELHDELPSEENTFKGLMAAGGCALLVLAVLGLLVLAVVEGFRLPLIDTSSTLATPPDAQHQRMHLLLRLWPVYPLVAFLLLQLLLLVARKPRKSRDD